MSGIDRRTVLKGAAGATVAIASGSVLPVP